MELPALALLTAVLMVKEAGVPIPVPGDLLVIGAGVATANGGLPAPLIVTALVAASVIGGAVQFALVRGRLRRTILRVLARFGVDAARIDGQATRLRRGGAVTVAVARMTPGVRIVTIAASGLAGLPAGSFLAGLVVGNGVFLTGHFILGAAIGPGATTLVARATLPLAAAAVMLAVIGAAGWALRRRLVGPGAASIAAPGASGSSGPIGSSVPSPTLPASPAFGPLAAFADWADACCPACLALSLVGGGETTGARG